MLFLFSDSLVILLGIILAVEFGFFLGLILFHKRGNFFEIRYWAHGLALLTLGTKILVAQLAIPQAIFLAELNSWWWYGLPPHLVVLPAIILRATPYFGAVGVYTAFVWVRMSFKDWQYMSGQRHFSLCIKWLFATLIIIAGSSSALLFLDPFEQLHQTAIHLLVLVYGVCFLCALMFLVQSAVEAMRREKEKAAWPKTWKSVSAAIDRYSDPEDPPLEFLLVVEQKSTNHPLTEYQQQLVFCEGRGDLGGRKVAVYLQGREAEEVRIGDLFKIIDVDFYFDAGLDFWVITSTWRTQIVVQKKKGELTGEAGA